MLYHPTLDGTRKERLSHLQNWRGDVVKLISAVGGGRRAEGARYSSYGVPWGIALRDIDGDGDVDMDDADFMLNWSGVPNNYDVRGDFDLDGDIDMDDEILFNSDSSPGLGWGNLSNLASRKGYAGYEHDGNFDVLAHVRNRVYASDLGRWTRRDPAGFVDGMNLYGYVRGNPLTGVDRFGLEREPPNGWMECAGGPGACGAIDEMVGALPPGGGAPPTPTMPQRNCGRYPRIPNPSYEPEPDGCTLSPDGVALPFLATIPIFTHCCNDHDICYGSCNCSQSECDDELRDCMKDACDVYFSESFTIRTFCKAQAQIYWEVVNGVGFDWWQDGQDEACLGYTPPPPPPPGHNIPIIRAWPPVYERNTDSWDFVFPY